jgi:SAM-dependent methyltransferase
MEKSMTMDPLVQFKEMQKQGWKHFAPLEDVTMVGAAQLVRFARVRGGQRVLDVGCGTGVVAITASRAGAKVSGLDLTPELLVRARENGQIAAVDVDWREGDAEALPFKDGEFDVVVSQFGHMFAPRPEVAIGEMRRVLKPGGTVAFSTWPPETCIGRIFSLVGSLMPPPPPGVSPPVQWGDVNIVRERLATGFKDLTFDRGDLLAPALSPQHHRWVTEHTAGPILKLVESLATGDPAKLAGFRRDYDAIAAEYHRDNVVRQSFLMTRATKS